jgi:hypothetical protein
MDRRFQKRMERYLSARIRACSASVRSLDPEVWFDLWHIHPDFKARANRAAPMAADATFQLLQVAVTFFSSRTTPIQMFATLCDNTGNNAVYLHSPNPNGTKFPHIVDGAVWGGEHPSRLSSVVISNAFEVGCIDHTSEVVHIIRPRA